MADERLAPVLMENVELAYTNFSGKETDYNPPGSRNFLVLLTDDEASAMAADGWNVKQFKDREEDGETLAGRPFLPVTIRWDPIPPKTVMLITEKGRTRLTEEMIGMLDWAEITNVDLIVRPSHYTVNGKSGIKAYVQSLYVTIKEDPLEEKYGVFNEEQQVPDGE